MTSVTPHWERGRIKWDTVMVTGATPSTEDDSFWLEGDDPHGIPFVAIADMSRRERVSSSAKSLSLEGLKSRNMPVGQPGTLLFAMYASVGEVAFLDISATWNQALLGITPDPGKVDSRFLRYVLLDMRDDLLRDVRSNTQSNLNARQVGDIWFQRPPLPEQQAIADYLDRETARIDMLIEEQQRLIEMLRERRWAVVERGVALLDWSTPFKTVTTLIQTGPFGSQLKSDEYEDGGIPVINPSHIVAGEVSADPRIAVSVEKAEQLARHKLQMDDLITARRGDLGRCAVIGPAAEGFLCGTGSALVRLDRTRMDPVFAAIVFSSRRNRDSLALASVGSTMENLNSDIIGALRIPVPPLDEQRRLTTELKQNTAKIDTLIAETERFVGLARERRSALITAAVTGQIDVREMV